MILFYPFSLNLIASLRAFPSLLVFSQYIFNNSTWQPSFTKSNMFSSLGISLGFYPLNRLLEETLFSVFQYSCGFHLLFLEKMSCFVF